ncbi:urea ABC transporter ATP-binding protein UrtD [Effusibacillus lacus]|uniref:ABC transporter ATP-binding protein n=1 Tax=Effusibacillus lacus TaxID=1348429 RepID=A0A292YIU3_9BACL|nr:urea ABC transporter ATP-binding protein UrtD [Effusibacillus lacus]TCS71232.1 urea ABC transporter ATP-binding protein [Effusibacillus lacus]GAX89858.1 ABC transporter ATP-binding protein [Effusibacillus lacus]
MSTILCTRNITVNFGGFKAIRNLNFEMKKGEVRFLIGPNGAGKTTLLDVICGKVKPVQGEVIFKENIELSKKQEHQIAQCGVGRKFQAPAVFGNLTVFENLELSRKRDRSLFSSLRARMTREEREAIQKQLTMINLQDKANDKASSLSHGQKQWLEIGMLLMQEPELLLLDEPVAGMTKSETEKTGELIQEIAQARSVLVVDHDMDFVRKFSDKVTVMHEGQILCEGSIAEVQENPRVAEVYLGRRAEAVC